MEKVLCLNDGSWDRISIKADSALRENLIHYVMITNLSETSRDILLELYKRDWEALLAVVVTM